MNKLKRKKAFKALSKYSSDGKAAIFTLGFTYVYLIVEIIYKFKFQKQSCGFELLLLFLMFAIYGFIKKLFTNSFAPKRFDGTLLPTGDSEEEKQTRNNYYKFSALLYSIVFSSVAFLGILFNAELLGVNLAIEFFFEKEVPNFIFSLFTTAIVFGISYLFTYMIDFLWYENIIAYANEVKNAENLDLKKDFKKIKSKEKKALKKEQKASKKAETSEKNTKAEIEVEESATQTETTVQEESAEETVEVIPADTQEAVAPAPKKRGRPKKIKPEEE